MLDEMQQPPDLSTRRISCSAAFRSGNAARRDAESRQATDNGSIAATLWT